MSAARALRGSMPTTASAWSRRQAATFAVNAQRETQKRLDALDAAVERVLGLMAARGHQMGPRRIERSGTGALCVHCGAWACVRQNPRLVAGAGAFAIYEWDLTDSFSERATSTHCTKREVFAK